MANHILALQKKHHDKIFQKHSPRALERYVPPPFIRPLYPRKLMQILYLAQGWHLARHDKPLFQDGFLVQHEGPVLPEVAQAIKAQGLSIRGTNKEPIAHQLGIQTPWNPRSGSMALAEKTWKFYHDQSSYLLEETFTGPGSPWKFFRHGTVIPDRALQLWFQKWDQKLAPQEKP